MKPLQVKIILTVGAILLFVLLFNAKRVITKESGPEKVENKASVSENASVEVYLNMAVKMLSEDEMKRYAVLEEISEKAVKFDTLAKFWAALKRPDLAAYSLEQKAINTGLAEDWFNAGNRYYYSIRFIQDESEIPALYQCATRSYKKGLNKDPLNADAKIMLATCYVEGTNNPMEGISLLREVEAIDSLNVKLQLAFAFFSVKSNQMDKAIQRFNKVLKINPGYLEAYLHLADIYEQMNDLNKTIESLENYAAATSDPFEKQEIEKYIQQLKQK